MTTILIILAIAAVITTICVVFRNLGKVTDFILIKDRIQSIETLREYSDIEFDFLEQRISGKMKLTDTQETELIHLLNAKRKIL